MNPGSRRKILQQMSYGLYFLGAPAPEGGCIAILANWVGQVSFVPPLLAISIERGSAIHAAITKSNCFTVNILPSEGVEIARGFLKSPSSATGSLNGREYRLSKKGCPVLIDSLSCVECDLRQTMECGDHTLFLGEAMDGELHEEGNGLLMKDTGLNYWKES